ncbi:MAG: DUF4007 family protein [Planctomycetaceae bacterium]|nr:DUF4007 family protein [Planctomycetaceae bacterium]
MDKLGPSFHRTFTLSRPAVADIIRLVREHQDESVPGRVLNFNLITAETTLGPVYISSMRRYAVATGVVDEQERLKPFGRILCDKDPGLQSTASCWVMHYYLCCPHGIGPAFWFSTIAKFFRPGDEIDRRQISEHIAEEVRATEGTISQQTALQTATVLLGTYAKSDALGPLGMLEPLEAGRYLVKEPSCPSLWTFAFILADYWIANWGEVPGVNLNRVSEAGGPGSILFMGSGAINKALGELQAAGFATVQRRTPPFQLNRNWSNFSQFVDKIYD